MAANWSLSAGTAETWDADQAARIAVFKKISPKHGWKNGIDCWIAAADYAECNEAAIWFTGGLLEVVESKAGRLHVVSGGYYQNIGA